MKQAETFVVAAIPLSRPEIAEFLDSAPATPRGAKLRIVAQRPTPQTEADWINTLQATATPTVSDLLTIDDPMGHLVETHTDRLVPVESLAKPNFLTRDLGGWVANFFGPVGLPQPKPDDPLLNQLEVLTEYGPRIRYFGADPALVSARLEEEMGGDVAAVVTTLARLLTLRQKMASRPTAYLEQLYTEIAAETYFADDHQKPIPDMLLYDELMSRLVRLELERRAALANGNEQVAEDIKAWQMNQQQKSGLRLILQGEYIVGRHRRSTVLIAPELGVVVKQPGPEPLHEIELSAKFVEGRKENWPYTTDDGALVTARGRVRLTLEEGLVPQLSQVFNHKLRFCSLLGLTIEPFVAGQTVQDFILADHSRLTPEIYEEIVLHQQVCELLGIENGDWHAPNFVRRTQDNQIVHIDWGAARPLRPEELTLSDKLARVNQISNMAFSFQRPDLAERLLMLHRELVTDEARMTQLRQRAQALIS